MFFNINIKFILLFFLVRETQILLNYSNNFIINSLQKISKLKKNCITVRKPPCLCLWYFGVLLGVFPTRLSVLGHLLFTPRFWSVTVKMIARKRTRQMAN